MLKSGGYNAKPPKMPQAVEEVIKITDTLMNCNCQRRNKPDRSKRRNIRKPSSFKGGAKGELLNAYAQAIAIMKSNPSLKDSLSPQEKKLLEDKVEELHQISIFNEVTITAAYETCQKIMLVVMDIAKKEQQTNAPYSRAGTLYRPASKAYTSHFGALAVDRRF